MQMTRTFAISSPLAVCVAAIVATLPFSLCEDAAAALHRAETAQAVPTQFLPWPPRIPSPAPSGVPPLAPSIDSFDTQTLAATLEEVLAAVQTSMDKLWRWLDSLRQAAAATLAQIVLPLTIGVPAGPAAVDLVAQSAALGEQWRAIITDALAKHRPSTPADPTATRHEADIEGSPELSHEAGSIAAADQQVVSNVVQQEVAIAAATTIAEAAAEDTALPAAVSVAGTTADQMIAGAQNLPSSRAGIQLLVAGTGAGLRNQAFLTVALASRMSGLIQQVAQLSSQIGALTSTVGIATERGLERDRDVLDARLGMGDATRGAETLLRRLLEGAGEPAGEIPLAPLY